MFASFMFYNNRSVCQRLYCASVWQYDRWYAQYCMVCLEGNLNSDDSVHNLTFFNRELGLLKTVSLE